PSGLAGSEIPLSTQVLTLADTFDALTSSRAYRSARAAAHAAQEILRERGKQFSPDLIAAFQDALPMLGEAMRLHAPGDPVRPPARSGAAPAGSARSGRPGRPGVVALGLGRGE